LFLYQSFAPYPTLIFPSKQELNDQEERETRMLHQHHEFSLFSHSYCHVEPTTEEASAAAEISRIDLPTDDVNITVLKDKGTKHDFFKYIQYHFHNKYIHIIFSYAQC
jgi:hypothetical protein